MQHICAHLLVESYAVERCAEGKEHCCVCDAGYCFAHGESAAAEGIGKKSEEKIEREEPYECNEVVLNGCKECEQFGEYSYDCRFYECYKIVHFANCASSAVSRADSSAIFRRLSFIDSFALRG